MTPEEGAAILDRAADLLLIDGWCQGQLHDGESHCIKGAVEAAVCETLGYDWRDFYQSGGVIRRTPSDVEWVRLTAVRHPLERVVSRYLGNAYIPEFNDAITTDEFQAIDTLRHAAKAVANGEIEIMR